jgi:hypothetical protein
MPTGRSSTSKTLADRCTAPRDTADLPALRWHSSSSQQMRETVVCIPSRGSAAGACIRCRSLLGGVRCGFPCFGGSSQPKLNYILSERKCVWSLAAAYTCTCCHGLLGEVRSALRCFGGSACQVGHHHQERMHIWSRAQARRCVFVICAV